MPPECNQPNAFCEVSEAQVRAIYDSNPVVNQYHTWEQVKTSPALYLALKNQAAYGIPGGPIADTEQPIQITTHQEKTTVEKKSYVLNRAEARELKTAITLARNCLTCPGIGEATRREALGSLYNAKQIFNRKEREQ